VRVFKTKWLERYARREGIEDVRLCDAVARAQRGVVDAKLGGNLIKQRVARKGAGRSGGYRTLIALRWNDRAVFLYAFAKSERDNIAQAELTTLKEIAAAWLAASDAKLDKAVADGILYEVRCAC
jgi:hypothetical protein